MNKPQKNAELAWKKIGEEILIIDSRSNKEVHRLNAVGSSIWELCNGENLFEDIVISLGKEYSLELDVARADTNEYIKKLGDMGLLKEAL
ncbi:MAG: PqqD family protein [Halobacteriovoraceae bacterium]|jgi:hypothetical protein|nr:PqqD family protein [Halobacteriovoraceae bacterium]MBT5094013.1 PqqD family protein [Halobacteriovoraceae bacterium]